MKYLGEHLDIHCGGIDNAFPHHTNEIAQSEAYLGHEWCKYWMHVLHLNTASGKMSKSKGEFLTLSLLESKGYSPMEYRFLCLGSHYRKSLVFTYENLENAASAYRKLIAKIALLAPRAGESFDEVGAEPLRRAFRDALDNDLNTSLAVTVLYDVLKAPVNDTTKEKLLSEFDTVLALGLLSEAEKLRQEKETAPAAAGDLSAAEIEAMIAARADAKKQKNYAEADRIRAELSAHGVVLTDTPTGTTYRVQ